MMLMDDMIELQSLIAYQRADRKSAGRIHDLPDAFMSLSDAGLNEETQEQPIHGCAYLTAHREHWSASGGVQEYIHWFSDGEDARYEMN